MKREDIKLALLQQVPWFVVCALTLDGGGLMRTCLVALIAFWLVVVLSDVCWRQKENSWSRRFVRWGFFPMFAAAWVVFPPEPLRVPEPHVRGTAAVKPA